MRLHGKIVGLLYFSLKGVKIMVRHFHALNVTAGGAYEVVMVVVWMEDLVPFHAVEDVYFGEDLIVGEEVELSVDGGLINGWMFQRDLLKQLWG